MNKTLYIVLAVVIVLAGAAWYFSEGGTTTGLNVTSTTTPESNAQTQTKTNSSSAASTKTITATINQSSLKPTGSGITLTGTTHNTSSIYLDFETVTSDGKFQQVSGVTVSSPKGTWSYESGFSPGTYMVRVYLNSTRTGLLAYGTFTIPQY